MHKTVYYTAIILIEVVVSFINFYNGFSQTGEVLQSRTWRVAAYGNISYRVLNTLK